MDEAMRTRYEIEPELIGPAGWRPGAREFTARWHDHRRADVGTFLFDSPEVARAAADQLDRAGIPHQRLYVFELDPDELRDYPALYLGIVMVDHLFRTPDPDEIALGHLELARDSLTDRIVASPRVQTLLSDIRGVRWVPLRGSAGATWWEMQVTAALPDPVMIPAPVAVGPNTRMRGAVVIRSDGRDVISERSIGVLREAGIAFSRESSIAGEVRPWRPRLVATGGVIARLLQTAPPGFMATAVPLLPVPHPLATKP